MRRFFSIGLGLSLLCLTAGGVLAQDSPDPAQTEAPAWLRVERANSLVDSEQFGRAIQLYREALTMDPGNPEALFGLGRAFRSVNDYAIAEEYLNDALENAERLRVPAKHYAIRYELAEIYSVGRRFAEYERLLTETIQATYEEPQPPGTLEIEPEVLRRTLRDEGLDRTMVLYRIPEDGATRARGDLCELLVGLGRYEAAVQTGLYSVVQQLTTLVEALIERDPQYEFRGVSDALAAAAVYPETRDYLARSRLFRDMYYVAAALYGQGDSARARELWILVNSAPQAGRSGVRAGIQLSDPEVEPLLVPPE